MERFTKFFTSLGGVLTSLAAVVGGVVALYVAFGSGGDNASQGSNPPAVVDTTSDATTSDAAIEDWRTQAEEVCRDLKRRATQLGPPPGDLAGLVSWMQQQMPIAISAASEMRALEEPDAIADDVGRFLDSLDNQVELNMTMFNALQAGDAVTFESRPPRDSGRRQRHRSVCGRPRAPEVRRVHLGFAPALGFSGYQGLPD